LGTEGDILAHSRGTTDVPEPFFTGVAICFFLVLILREYPPAQKGGIIGLQPSTTGVMECDGEILSRGICSRERTDGDSERTQKEHFSKVNQSC
jgi:hypothetical protein